MIILNANCPISGIDFAEGCLIPFDKDPHWTSFDVVNKIRNTVRVRKVGHAGTLDPLADGLVLLCTGKYTKKLNELMGLEKEYTGSITFGQVTPSYDLETELTVSGNTSELTINDIREASRHFLGEIDQIPPIYSAIKVDGERAYKKARKKEPAKLLPRKVTISELEIISFENPTAHFRLVCSKGTYVRSLAHDLGEQLKVGAHLSKLTRTRIGEFQLSSAWKVGAFVEAVKKYYDEDH